MNMELIMKLMAAKNQFAANHPKFGVFLKAVFAKGIVEGTVIEITVKDTDGKEMTTNLKVQASDLELMNSLKDISGAL